MTPLHEKPPSPSPLLALVCLAIVHRHCSPWLALPLAQAARAQRVSPERVSRLATRAVVAFDPIIATFTRRGRPPGELATDTQATELALYRALLDVATSILRRLSARTRWLRPLVIGAWLQLRDTHPQLTQERFCQVLGQSPRTLRQWLRESTRNDSQKPLEPGLTKPPPNKPRTRGLRRPRFGFDTVLPDTQYAADTTDLRAFGVSLKLIAAQNVGGRDRDLLDSVLVDDHESAEHVVTALAEALADKPGAQLLHDQGTPYMSERVRACLEQVEVEQVPQREGDPQGKATIERAFGSAKDLARPLLRLTNALADKLPVLKRPDLASAASRLVLTTVLRAYQAGARACRRAEQQRGGLSEQQLAQAAERQRDDARATERSKRLLLTHLHALYDFARPIQRFVRDLRRYPLEVLQDADRAFRSQAHRDDIRDRASYFGAIVRTCFDAWRTERTRQQHELLQRDQRARGDAFVQAQQRAWRADPIQWLRDALDGLAAQWMPATGSLFAGGQGAALAWLEKSLELIAQGPAPRPIALGVLYDFRRANVDRIGPQGLDAIEKILLRELDRNAPLLDPTLHYTVQDGPANMRIPGLQRHPGPDLPLRI
jgi:hypothetical protein